MKDIDKLLGKITFLHTKSKNSIVGDAYWDEEHGCISIYDGTNWNLMSTSHGDEIKRKNREEIINKLIGKEKE